MVWALSMPPTLRCMLLFDDLAARVHDVDVDSPAVGLHHELVPVRIYEDREVRAPAPVVYPLVAVVVPA